MIISGSVTWPGNKAECLSDATEISFIRPTMSVNYTICSLVPQSVSQSMGPKSKMLPHLEMSNESQGRLHTDAHINNVNIYIIIHISSLYVLY